MYGGDGLYGSDGEESNPIGGTFGSRAVAGLVSPDQPGLAEGLALYGRSVSEILACRKDLSRAACYLELHIEQGDRLDQNHLQIGIVSGIVGIVRYEVTAVGQSNHAGTTMMKNRRDAMVAMAKLITAADARARELDETLVLTVGTAEVFPGSENVIPSRVICCFEMRHMDSAVTDQLAADIQRLAGRIENADFIIRKKIEKSGVRCDEALMQRINRVCEELELSHLVMPSGAGHDANPMAHRLPVGMLFVPSKDGISHDGREWTEPADLENGVAALTRTLILLDEDT